MKIIDKLSTYAALIGVVSAIGGGFYAWGEFNTRLSAIENEPPINLTPLKDGLKETNENLSEAKVDLIDRIKKVDDKIVKTYLTTVFKEIAKVREEMALLDIPDEIDLKPISKELKRLSEELVRIVSTIPKAVNLEPLINEISELEKSVAIALKENELQDVMIEEIKTKANNPLAN